MPSNETSWIDLVKKHRWKIIVAGICIFAGIAYFSMESRPITDPSSSPSSTSSSSSSPSSSSSSSSSPSVSRTAEAPPVPTTNTGTAAPEITSPPTATAPPIAVGTTPQAPTASDWRPTANAFAKAWANPKAGQEAWLSALKPTVTSDLYDQFSNTDVEQMSQLEVSSISSEQEDYTGVNARVFFQNTDFTIMIHLTPQADLTWLVTVATSS